MTTKTNPSPSSDDLSTRLAVTDELRRAFGKAAFGEFVVDGDTKDIFVVNPPGSCFGHDKTLVAKCSVGDAGWMSAHFLACAANFAAAAVRAEALVPAPSPARVLAVTEKMVEAGVAGAATVDFLGRGDDDTIGDLRKRLIRAALEAALSRTSPSEAGGGGDATVAVSLEPRDGLMTDLAAELNVEPRPEIVFRAALDRLEKAAALSSAPTAEETWQAIETAPKDGTPILAAYTLDYMPGEVYQAVIWSTPRGMWQGGPSAVPGFRPTHWQPLTAPPQPPRDEATASRGGEDYVENTSTNEGFVEALYRNLLGREPDRGLWGADGHINQLNAKRGTRHETVAAFITSDEFIAKYQLRRRP